jgi:hypothetical protein
VTDETQARAAAARFGRIDMLVNAGRELLAAVEEASSGELEHWRPPALSAAHDAVRGAGSAGVLT